MTPQKILLLILLGMATLTTSVAAVHYTISSGYDHSPDGAIPMTPTPVGLLELPLWILLLQVACLPIESIAVLKVWVIGGYRRVSGSNALTNPLRKEIYERICEEPGIHLHEVARKTKATLSTIRYHCTLLERSHLIRVMEDKGFKRFFQNGGTYSRSEQDLLSCLRSETTSEILRIVMVHPEISRQEIADAIGKSGPSITWHMQRLEEKGLLSIRRDGRSVRYRIDGPTSILLAQTMAKTEAI